MEGNPTYQPLARVHVTLEDDVLATHTANASLFDRLDCKCVEEELDA